MFFGGLEHHSNQNYFDKNTSKSLVYSLFCFLFWGFLFVSLAVLELTVAQASPVLWHVTSQSHIQMYLEIFNVH